jgi:hypothetical protein
LKRSEKENIFPCTGSREGREGVVVGGKEGKGPAGKNKGGEKIEGREEKRGSRGSEGSKGKRREGQTGSAKSF